ncbi:MAG: hypothetical protein LBL83_00030 [Clostridiales bacterium]|jgi:hypothetical protein|nr:hypothetical protein [Clostridiales bacterium]
MKRLLAMICAICALCQPFCGFAAPSGEAGGGAAREPSGVTITLVIPDPAEPAPPAEKQEAGGRKAPGAQEAPETPEAPGEPEAPETRAPQEAPAAEAYPSDVAETRENGGRQITKTYELGAGESPGAIPRGPFERDGWRYALADITRRETASAETREHAETATISTDTKDLEKILPQLPQTMEYAAEDGFAGILALDVASIAVETAGTKTSSYAMSVTREYPRLSASDASLVPKTVEDRGKTFALAGVEWKAGGAVAVDGEQIPEHYTAVATYTATGKSTKATGYSTSAVYRGTLARLSQGKTVYAAQFIGEEMPEPPETAAAPALPGASGENPRAGCGQEAAGGTAAAGTAPGASPEPAAAAPTPAPQADPAVAAAGAPPAATAAPPASGQEAALAENPQPAAEPSAPAESGAPGFAAAGACAPIAAAFLAAAVALAALFLAKRRAKRHEKNDHHASSPADSGDGGSPRPRG